MLSLGQISHNYINFHCYADDNQLYVPLAGNSNTLPLVRACLSDMKCWMSQNFLQLNESKSEVLLFDPPSLDSNMQDHLGNLSSNIQHSAWNLGVIFDSNLCFDIQITKVVQTYK